MANINRIPGARQTLIDDTGLATSPWYRFWEYLSQLANGQLTPEDVLAYAATRNETAGLATQQDVEGAQLMAGAPQTAGLQQQIDDALLLGWIK